MADYKTFLDIAKYFPTGVQQRVQSLLMRIVYKPETLTVINSGGTDDERLTAIETILQNVGLAR